MGTGCAANGVAWTAEERAALSRLWMQDNPRLSTARIGVLLGRSKNAAVGEAHRLGLPGRPNPIAGRNVPPAMSIADSVRICAARRPGASLQDIAAELGVLVTTVEYQARKLGITRAREARTTVAQIDANDMFAGWDDPAAGERAPVRRTRLQPQQPVLYSRTCQWLSGARHSYEACGAPSVRGSYCGRHAAKCYVGVHGQ